MDRLTFSYQVKLHFHYLIANYRFNMTKEHGDPNSTCKGYILFESDRTFISIACEQGFVYLDIGPTKDPNKPRYNLAEVIEYLHPVQYRNLKIFGAPDSPSAESMDIQWKRLAFRLHQNCQPILNGEFEEWADLEQHSKRKLQEFRAKQLPKFIEQMRDQDIKRSKK